MQTLGGLLQVAPFPFWRFEAAICPGPHPPLESKQAEDAGQNSDAHQLEKQPEASTEPSAKRLGEDVTQTAPEWLPGAENAVAEPPQGRTQDAEVRPVGEEESSAVQRQPESSQAVEQATDNGNTAEAAAPGQVADVELAAEGEAPGAELESMVEGSNNPEVCSQPTK